MPRQENIVLTDKEKQNIEFYDQNVDAWIKTDGYLTNSVFWINNVKRFKELLPSGSVLEVGASGGRDARHFLEAGYQYTGIDASRPLLAHVREHYPGAFFLEQNVYDLNFPADTFDGVWFVGLPVHIPHNRMDLVLSNIQNVMKPGGIGFISLFVTKPGFSPREYLDPSGRHGYQPGPGRWMYSYDRNEFFKELQRHGFMILEYEIKPHKGTWGPPAQEVEWMGVFVKCIKAQEDYPS